MPMIISGNTSVPCMMIGEKCAEMILSDQEITTEPGSPAKAVQPAPAPAVMVAPLYLRA
jgi:choline dehydrogenase